MLLTDWRKDRTNKVLIFTKSVKLLTMLEFHLNNRGAFSFPEPSLSDLPRYLSIEYWVLCVGFGYVKLEGKTHSKDRMSGIYVSMSISIADNRE